MDQEIAEAMAWTPPAVLGLIEFKVTGRKKVIDQYVNRTFTVRRNYKLSSPAGSCTEEEGFSEKEIIEASMVHLGPIDMYRDLERWTCPVASAPAYADVRESWTMETTEAEAE
jgi:hypothetical protein